MRRFGLALALILVVAAFLAGCGDGSSARQGGTTTEEATSQASAPDPAPDRAEGSDAKKEVDNHRPVDSGKPAEKVQRPADAQTHKNQPEVAQEAIERVERLQQRASKPLTPEDLEEIAERQIARSERLADPPPGKTVADVLQEIEEEIEANGP